MYCTSGDLEPAVPAAVETDLPESFFLRSVEIEFQFIVAGSSERTARTAGRTPYARKVLKLILKKTLMPSYCVLTMTGTQMDDMEETHTMSGMQSFRCGFVDSIDKPVMERAIATPLFTVHCPHFESFHLRPHPASRC